MTELAIVQEFTSVEGMWYETFPLFDGIQIMFRFPNGAGVSIIRHSVSYGGYAGLWEAAPVLYRNDSWREWDFIGEVFDLPGFSREPVAGWLTPSDIDGIIAMVASL